MKTLEVCRTPGVGAIYFDLVLTHNLFSVVVLVQWAGQAAVMSSNWGDLNFLVGKWKKIKKNQKNQKKIKKPNFYKIWTKMLKKWCFFRNFRFFSFWAHFFYILLKKMFNYCKKFKITTIQSIKYAPPQYIYPWKGYT